MTKTAILPKTLELDQSLFRRNIGLSAKGIHTSFLICMWFSPSYWNWVSTMEPHFMTVSVSWTSVNIDPLPEVHVPEQQFSQFLMLPEIRPGQSCHPMRNFPYDSCCADRDLPLNSLSSCNIKCCTRTLSVQYPLCGLLLSSRNSTSKYTHHQNNDCRQLPPWHTR